MDRIAYRLVAGGAAVLFAWAARQAAQVVWSQFSDTDSPVNPESDDATWPQAVAWAVLAGVAAGSARVLARRGSAAVWKQVVGEEPPTV